MMMNAVPIGHEDGDAYQVKGNQVLVENKERFLRKTFFVVLLAFVVVCSIRMQNSPVTPASSSSSSNLFGERALKGLFGLCGKKKDDPTPPADDGFTQVTYGATLTGQTVAVGETKMYKSTVPKGAMSRGRADYATGEVNLYMSYDKTKPADETDNGIACQNSKSTAQEGFENYCVMGSQFMETTVYVWIVGVAATTYDIEIKAFSY